MSSFLFLSKINNKILVLKMGLDPGSVLGKDARLCTHVYKLHAHWEVEPLTGGRCAGMEGSEGSHLVAQQAPWGVAFLYPFTQSDQSSFSTGKRHLGSPSAFVWLSSIYTLSPGQSAMATETGLFVSTKRIAKAIAAYTERKYWDSFSFVSSPCP